MRSWLAIGCGVAVLTACTGAHAASLSVVNVAAPAVNCVFDATCKIVVNDSTGSLQFTAYGANAFVQSRTYAGKAGTPGAGTTAYEYRIALDKAAFTECVAGVTMDFGPVKALPYPNHPPAHVFVTTQGGLGTVGIKSAEQDGNFITFTFDTYLCPGQSTYFFGLAATGAPKTSTATMFAIGAPPFTQTAARVPVH